MKKTVGFRFAYPEAGKFGGFGFCQFCGPRKNLEPLKKEPDYSEIISKDIKYTISFDILF
jgi:hypothetical protein